MRNLGPWIHTCKPTSIAGRRLPLAGELVAPGAASKYAYVENTLLSQTKPGQLPYPEYPVHTSSPTSPHNMMWPWAIKI